jgi:hypothetical protein
MNAFEIIRRDLELNSYDEDPIRNNPTQTRIDGNQYGRKFLSITAIMTGGQNKTDHPDSMKGQDAVPDTWAKRIQRYTLPEDDAYLVAWAYHLYTIGLQSPNKTYANIEELMGDIAKEPDVNGFLDYMQSPDLKMNKDTMGVKNNVNLRIRMKNFLSKWGVNVGEIERSVTVYRIINYMLLWNQIQNTEE